MPARAGRPIAVLRSSNCAKEINAAGHDRLAPAPRPAVTCRRLYFGNNLGRLAGFNRLAHRASANCSRRDRLSVLTCKALVQRV